MERPSPSCRSLLPRELWLPLIAALASACAQVPGTPGAAALKLDKCGLANMMEPVLCGDLPVPEDRQHPARTITLNVVVIPAAGERTLPPLYFLDGGPGIAATGGAQFWMGPGAAYREHRDIVLMDQRGTGASAPLPCAASIGDPFRPVLDAPAVADCRDRLAQVANLARYTTTDAVQDLEALRVALGHERIDLNGLSYGTRVAQEYLRAYPGRVRAMALLGTLSPEARLPLSFARDATAVLDRLAQQCAADRACHKAVPDLARDVAALRDKLARGPLTIRRRDGRRATLEAGPFWEGVRGQLASTDAQRRLPWRLHQAARGDFEPLVLAMAPKAELTTLGALLAATCPEDTLRITDADIAAQPPSVFGSYRVTQQLAACRAFGVPALADPRPGFVASDVPILLMAGDMDYVTPVEQAQAVAAHLANARLVIVPYLGNFPDGLAHMECYHDVINRFFAAGTAANLDVSCLATMQPPPFQTKAQ